MALLFPVRIIVTLILLFFRIDVSGQSTTNAIVSATVTDVVGAIKLSDMNSGNFLIGSKAETIEFNSIQANKVSGNNKFFEFDKIAELASFNIIGSNYAYAVTIPSSSVILKRNTGNETIVADMFNVTFSKYIFKEFSQILYFGATIKIGASQVAGYYIPITPIPVTVHYN